MTDTNFPMTGDDEFDDLPRTLRRERDRQAADAAAAAAPALEVDNDRYTDSIPDELVPATVRHVDVPFFRLVLFLIKVVVAAIPALILLAVILWFAGQALQAFFPELVQMKILISFPIGADS